MGNIDIGNDVILDAPETSAESTQIFLLRSGGGQGAEVGPLSDLGTQEAGADGAGAFHIESGGLPLKGVEALLSCR